MKAVAVISLALFSILVAEGRSVLRSEAGASTRAHRSRQLLQASNSTIVAQNSSGDASTSSASQLSLQDLCILQTLRGAFAAAPASNSSTPVLAVPEVDCSGVITLPPSGDVFVPPVFTTALAPAPASPAPAVPPAKNASATTPMSVPAPASAPPAAQQPPGTTPATGTIAAAQTPARSSAVAPALSITALVVSGVVGAVVLIKLLL